MNIKKISAVAAISLTSTLLIGCSTENNETQKADMTPKTGITEITKAPIQTSLSEKETTSITTEISDEAFEKAFAKYLKEKPVEFGTQVDSAYKIYQEDLKNQEIKKQTEKVTNVRDISANDHITGSDNPTFVLFEYSDYHCPYCKRFNETTHEFLKKNEDVAIVFRAYPAVHKTTSQPIHEAAECVARESGNEAFWKFSDEAFSSQFKKEEIEAKLKKLEIENPEKIMKCYNDGTFTSLIDESAQEAVNLGIQGTPGSILKNMKTGEVRFIGGAYPISELEKFKKELSEVK